MNNQLHVVINLPAGASVSHAQVVQAPVIPTHSVRSDYCELHPYNRDDYRRAQKLMYGACRKAGLDTTQRAAMLSAINELLDTTITSRKQLTPLEMMGIAYCAEHGYWQPGWVVTYQPHSLAA